MDFAKIFQSLFERLKKEIKKAIVGQDEIVEDLLVAFFAQGHVLLEGLPGLGKTQLVKSFSDTLKLTFSRVQFTPDLMPADITGTSIVTTDSRGNKNFEFRKGPIFANIVLADEINRATPKTQAAMLEAMQEKQITILGKSIPLPKPFLVIATQNPIEQEGTYPLPEAQLDRFFFKLLVNFPSLEDLTEIIKRTVSSKKIILNPQIEGNLEPLFNFLEDFPIADHVLSFAAQLIVSLHPESDQAPYEVKKYLVAGPSPRGLQTLIKAAKVRAAKLGQPTVSREDIVFYAKQSLRHRIILSFEAEAEGISPDFIIDKVVRTIHKKVSSPLA